MSYVYALLLTEFVPHGYCLQWQPDVIWLHVISDALTALAYASIPFLLLSVVRKRKDIPFSWMLVAFSAFIVACGATHVMSIVTLWKPVYILEGIVKAITGVASIVTAICLRSLLPIIGKLPSPAQLQNAHDELAQSYEALELANRNLEQRVTERTAQLAESNARLRASVDAFRETNSELRKAHTWLQAVLHSTTEVSIMALDDDGIISFFNSGAERMLGYRAEEVVGRCTPQMLYPPEECEIRARQLSAELGRTIPVAEIFLAVNQPRTSFVSESVYLHRNGTRIDISLAISPMIDSDGERLGKLAIAVDMTPRKALELELTRNNLQLQEQTKRAEDANRAKSDFLSAMSHEIRTPLNAILGMADLLSESELNVAQAKYVEVFRRAGADLLTLVNGILDLSKIESNHFELEQVDFNLTELVERTFDLIRPRIQAKSVTLLSYIAPGTPSDIVGDPTRLQQILLNLLGNAVKFTQAGEIGLTIYADAFDPSRLHFEVTDSGIGIPVDKLDSVFDDFTQGESSTTRRFGGTGLGLGICRRLVNRMGGQLNVRSELGKGSSFYFDGVFAAGSQHLDAHPEPVAGLAGRRVLIIDDNSTNRLMFSNMCGTWGMLPSTCASAGTAIRALRTAVEDAEPFDLIIIDRFMHEVDGFELVSRIRQTSPRLPIIMTISDNLPGDQTKGLQLGIAEYAVKPVSRSELLRLICKSLGGADNDKRLRAPKLDLPGQPAQGPGGTAAPRILIAEDSEDNRFLFHEYLKGSPYEITFVENGEQAVKSAGSQSFSLILMDMQMPIMDGLTATKLIRQAEGRDGRARVPLLALTANARQEDIQISQAAGCTAHISKPISRQKLLCTIAEHLPRTPIAMSPALPIDIPLGLEAAAKRYIHSRRDEVPLLVNFAAMQNFDQLRALAHNMKGTGTSYGFPGLTRLGRMIESSAQEQDAAVLKEHLFELSKYVQEAEEAVTALG